VVRLTIQRKLFLAALVLTTTMVLMLLVLIRWNLGQGFERYTVAAEFSRLDWLVAQVEAEYARNQGWDFVRRNPDAVWRRLSRPGPGSGPPPPPRDHFAAPPRPLHGHEFDGEGPPRDIRDSGRVDEAWSEPPEDRTPPPNDPLNIGPRLTLLDEGGRWLAGARFSSPQAASRALTYNGQVVGTIQLHPSPGATAVLETSFLTSQTNNVVLAGAIVLIVSLIAAWLLFRQIMAPVGELKTGAQKISEGRLDYRIPIRTEDELGELSQVFNRMAERLQWLETSRKNWISDASHELRTPLAVLRAEIEALQDGVRSADAMTFDRLHKQVGQLGTLIEDLRETLDQPTSVGLFEQTLFAPVEALETVLDGFKPRFQRENLRIDWVGLHESGLLVRGDAGRMMQVFTNLLENSLRYTDSGGYLRIAVESRDDRISFVFEDTDPAPSRQDLPSLFDRFFRSEPSRNRAHGGSGLGLAICKKIVEAHSGVISTWLSPLGGLGIRIDLPLEKR
jgi:two-component system, OmpR family, sensor histidine kinase BaeS